ncbi:MAG TPA: hypothetical protein VFA38_04425 [Nitrospirales bacterium]|nr:hypothetical protein [Nitrospirales bacterium]
MCDVDLPGRLVLSASDHSDWIFCVIEKRPQALLPLGEQLGAMGQNQGVYAAPGDDGRCRHCLAECSWRAQYLDLMTQHHGNGRFLVGA